MRGGLNMSDWPLISLVGIKYVRKNGQLLTDTKYRLGTLRQMTKQELIEEILGTHSWDYLLEYDMVRINGEGE